MSFVLAAFFFTYALFQIPIGSLADRYGPRLILTLSIIAWSLCTAATSLAAGAAALLAVRLCLGACEAGAYPAAAGLVRRWASAAERGRLSSIVAFGGRIGGAVAPILTAWAAVRLLGDPLTGEKDWRAVFLLYGVLGLLAAVAFWFVARDAPAAHPWTNAAEADRVPPAGPAQASAAPWAATTARPGGQPEHVAVRRNPVLRQHRLGVPDHLPAGLPARALRNSIPKPSAECRRSPLIASCLGMAVGGLFADCMYHRLGPRWGRSAPIAVGDDTAVRSRTLSPRS